MHFSKNQRRRSRSRQIECLEARALMAADSINAGLVPVGHGDANFDGVVDSFDVAALSQHFGARDASHVDFDGNGLVDIFDLSIISANFGKYAAVPLGHGQEAILPAPSAELGGADATARVEAFWNAQGIEVVAHLDERGTAAVRAPKERLASWIAQGRVDAVLSSSSSLDKPPSLLELVSREAFGADRPAAWDDGDWNGDGRANSVDLALLIEADWTDEDELDAATAGEATLAAIQIGPAPGLAGVLAEFNRGMSGVRGRAGAIAKNAWAHDVADLPFVKSQPSGALSAGKALRSALAGGVTATAAIDQALVELQQQGFVVEHLADVADARGDFLRVSRVIQGERVVRPSLKIGGGEGFEYWAAMDGSAEGRARARAAGLQGRIVIGVDANGFYLDDSSEFAIPNFEIRAQGLTGEYKLGALNDVSAAGNLNIEGSLRARFADADGRVRLGEVAKDEIVVGMMDATATLKNGRFSAQLPFAATAAWTGEFQQRIQGQRITNTENLTLPSYQKLIQQIDSGLVTQLRDIDFFRQVVKVLDQDLPIVDKSLADLLGLENKISSGISIAGLSYLSPADADAAMRQLIRGQNAQLLHFEQSDSRNLLQKDLGEIPLVDWSLISPSIFNVKVSAFANASLDFSYKVVAGVDTLGMWIGDDTQAALRGRVEGGLRGKFSVFDLVNLKAEGSLGLTAAIETSLVDATPHDGRVYLAELSSNGKLGENLFRALQTELDVDLVGRLKGVLDLPIIGDVTLFNESWTLADLFHETLIPGEIAGQKAPHTLAAVSRGPAEDYQAALRRATPTLAAPAVNREDVRLTPTFKWNNVAQATEYELVLYRDDPGHEVRRVRVPKSAGAFTEYTIPEGEELRGDRRYWWTVQAIKGKQTGPASEKWAFVSREAPLENAPTLLRPADGLGSARLAPTFEWTNLKRADSYVLVIYRDNPSNEVRRIAVPKGAGDTTSFTLPDELRGDRDYFWTVLGVNSRGQGPAAAKARFHTRRA